MMIKEGVILNETQLAEILFNQIIDKLKAIHKKIDCEFSFETVVKKEDLIDDFSFDKLFEILKQKRVGAYYKVFGNMMDGYYNLEFKFKELS